MNPKEKGWLPEGVTQDDLDDGDFAWLSDAYKKGDESKTDGRKLPFKIHGKVNEDGWKAAWSRAHQDGTDFSGDPSQEAVIAKLLKAKPAGVDVSDDGKSSPNRIEYKTFEFKAGNSDGLQEDEFQGYLAVFNNLDAAGDVIFPGAFAKTLPNFLVNGKVCWQHDQFTPIGKWLDAHEDAHGLFVKGKISQTTAGKDALILLRDGVVNKMSIGYQPEGYRMLSDSEGISMFGETAYSAALRNLPWYQDGIRGLTDIKLYEGSPVTFPANDQADITGVKDSRLLAGLPLETHFKSVLAALTEYEARMAGLVELRRKSGRMLSQANRDKLQAMHDSMSEHLQTLGDLLAPTVPDQGDAEEAGEAATDGQKAAAHIESIRQESLRFEQWLFNQQGVL